MGHGTLRRSDLQGNEIAALSVGQNEWTASGPWGIATLLRPEGTVPAASRAPPAERTRGRGSGGGRAGGGGGGWAGAQASGSVFWTCWGRVRSCQLGSSHVTDVVKGLIDPRGIAIDRARGRIFWTDYRAGKVRSGNSSCFPPLPPTCTQTTPSLTRTHDTPAAHPTLSQGDNSLLDRLSSGQEARTPQAEAQSQL